MRALLDLFTELSCAYFTYSVAQRYRDVLERRGRDEVRARRRTRPLRPVHRVSGKHSIALSERGLRTRSSRAVHAKCQSRRIYNRSVALTIHVKLAACATASYCLSGVAHDNCLPHRRAHCAHVAQHSSRPAQRRRRRTCEGGACMRWYGIGDRACMRVMCCVRVRT